MTKILAVDDSPSLRQMVAFTLKGAGHDVSEAADGVEALGIAKGQAFDLVITDINMPNMDGLDFYKALSKNRKWSEIPFLLITAEKERDKVIEAVKAGIKEYLVKPVVPEKLGSKIKEVVFGGAD